MRCDTGPIHTGPADGHHGDRVAGFPATSSTTPWSAGVENAIEVFDQASGGTGRNVFATQRAARFDSLTRPWTR